VIVGQQLTCGEAERDKQEGASAESARIFARMASRDDRRDDRSECMCGSTHAQVLARTAASDEPDGWDGVDSIGNWSNEV